MIRHFLTSQETPREQSACPDGEKPGFSSKQKLEQSQAPLQNMIVLQSPASAHGKGKGQKGRQGDEFELQVEPALLARLTALGDARSLIRRGSKSSVASSAPSPLSNQHSLPLLRQVSNELPGISITGHRAERHLDENIIALPALLPLALAVGASLGFEMNTALEADEGVQVRIGHQVDIATLAAIPAVRSAQGHVFLAAEADTAIPAVTSFNVNLGFIEEHSNHSLAIAAMKAPTSIAAYN